MGKQKFSIEFKLEVIGKYEMGTCGYKKLAKMYGLSRDTVRSWVLNPKLKKLLSNNFYPLCFSAERFFSSKIRRFFSSRT